MIIRLILALALFASMPAAGANRYAATLVPAERFDVGATLVERHGEHGTPLILIPGLASGAWTWQETVRQMMPSHVVYVLTLPGFDGRSFVPGKGLAAAQDSVRDLIALRKLSKPVLVGHSLGGTLALALAARNPDLIGGVVSIDGLPLFPGTEDWPADKRSEIAAGIANQMKPGSQAMFAAQQQQYMRGIGVTDMARADELAKLTATSDPLAVMKYMVDALTLDLRAELPSITAPVLVMSPYFNPDAEQLQMTQAAKTEYYQALMKGTVKLKVISIAPARHFAMLDQPQQVNDAIAEFLASRP